MYKIRENTLFGLPIFIVGILMIAMWFLTSGERSLFENASAATSSAVTVTASVATSISCASNVTTTDFGVLTSASISTSTSDASTTMSCSNNGPGCTLSITDTGSTGSSTPHGGLYNSTTTTLIPSPSSTFVASSTLSAGNEGYGVQATTTASGSGATLTLNLRYRSDLLGTNGVGGLSTTTLTLASSTNTVTNREIVVKHKATIASLTLAGTYNDTITYSCTAN